ncbi:hypothetical protein CROQUDRAFT_478906 [Cronartium quercuum f. sp. fusiforme G11]|uniref:Uncharacterized protein n=1 Tax=Cronartium quercuum f. sp. fusiforme G11 TaxID=708437 RepID=A0A9P6TCD9_9BASI|nr:hypothetical protein CROQUDRAFT_478906 [Cronartium quercuum f. sp. fusiforme G11]
MDDPFRRAPIVFDPLNTSSTVTSTFYSTNYASDSTHSPPPQSPLAGRLQSFSSDDSFNPDPITATAVRIRLTSQPSTESTQSSSCPSYNSKSEVIRKPNQPATVRAPMGMHKLHQSGRGLDSAEVEEIADASSIKKPQQKKKKKKKKKKSQLAADRNLMDDDGNDLDGYVDVPPSFTLPQFYADGHDDDLIKIQLQISQ